MHQVLPNLESLKESHLKDDLMPKLEKLPNLMILDLVASRGRRGLSISSNGSNFIYPERLRSLPSPDRKEFCLSSVPACSSAYTPSASVPACSSAFIPVASGDRSTDSRSASKATMSCNRVKQRSTITTMLTYPLKHQSWL
ncbi:hypothetical protein ACOSP7_004715 [Xanthoceras sorbifolium]